MKKVLRLHSRQPVPGATVNLPHVLPPALWAWHASLMFGMLRTCRPMRAGVARADAALLIVDGSPGGFESGFRAAAVGAGGGQTREHAQLARCLGIDALVIVITKLDTCEYSQVVFSQAQHLAACCHL